MSETQLKSAVKRQAGNRKGWNRIGGWNGTAGETKTLLIELQRSTSTVHRLRKWENDSQRPNGSSSPLKKFPLRLMDDQSSMVNHRSALLCAHSGRSPDRNTHQLCLSWQFSASIYLDGLWSPPPFPIQPSIAPSQQFRRIPNRISS